MTRTIQALYDLGWNRTSAAWSSSSTDTLAELDRMAQPRGSGLRL
ncbi:MAG: hypothetical protein ACRDQD_30630 [Nocardioidaceae bacterium]